MCKNTIHMPFSKKKEITTKKHIDAKEEDIHIHIPSTPGQIGPSMESPNYKQLAIALASVRDSTQ